MFIGNNSIKVIVPEDGFYFIENNKCYKLTGTIVDLIYDTYNSSKTSFKVLMKNYKNVAEQCNCTNTCAKNVLTAFYKIYRKGYYSDYNNLQWFLSIIKKVSVIDIIEI